MSKNVPWTCGIAVGHLKGSANSSKLPNRYRWAARLIFDEHVTVTVPVQLTPLFVGLLARAALTALEGLYVEESDRFLRKTCTWLRIRHGITITPSMLSGNLLDVRVLTPKIRREIAAERNEVARKELRDMLQTQFIAMTPSSS